MAELVPSTSQTTSEVNQPMTHENIHNGDDDEESFVILGQSINPSFESLQIEDDDDVKATKIIETGLKLTSLIAQNMDSVLPKMPPMEDGQSGVKDVNDPTISISTVSSELISDDLQTKINELIDENTQLKKTIIDNNTSFKSQRDRILSWQQEVQKVLDENKQQFKDAKQCIEMLKQENANLLHELELHRKNSLGTTTLENTNIQKLNVKIAALEQELKQEKSKQIEATSGDQKLHEALVEMNNLSAEMDKLKLENEKWKKQVDGFQATMDANAQSKIDELTNKCAQLEYEYQQSQDTLKGMNRELTVRMTQQDVLSLENEQLKNTVARLTEEINKVKAEIEAPKPGIIQEHAAKIETLTRKLDSSNKYVEQLKTENRNISQLIVSTNEQLANVQQQFMTLQLKNRQLNDLKTELEQKIQVNEENYKKALEEKDSVYQIQLDYYKNDFETERSAKDTIKQERDQLAEDLANIQRRNRELQEEIELLRENDYVVPSRNSRASPASSAHSNTSQTATYMCPICNVKFRSIRILEEHVETCPLHT